MTAMTLTTTRRTTWPVGSTLGCASGAALVVAGVWNALVQQHVTVSSPPTDVGPQTLPLQAMHDHYTWYASTVAQERGATILGILGVTGLVITAVELRRRLLAGLLGSAACTALQTGGVVWVAGALVGIGGHRAVALMATHGNPIQAVNAVAFTTDVTSDAFSTTAFVLFALGMGALTTTSYGGRRWALLTLFTGALALVVAYGYVAGIDAITTFGLGVLAAVLLPIWLVWTGRLLDHTPLSD
jgi:hypothetical protein